MCMIGPAPLHLLLSDDVDADLPPLPAGTPRCNDCGGVLLPMSGRCVYCEAVALRARPDADEPLRISDEPVSGDPLDLGTAF